MNLTQFLNLLILSLSVGTVLITLIAYIIFQFRRLNLINNTEVSQYNLESVFFKRFDPHIEQKILIEKNIFIEKENEKKLKVKKWFFRTVSFFVISSLLYIGYYFLV